MRNGEAKQYYLAPYITNWVKKKAIDENRSESNFLSRVIEKAMEQDKKKK